MKDYEKTIKRLKKSREIIKNLEIDKKDYFTKMQSYNAVSYINLAIMDLLDLQIDQDKEMASVIKAYNDTL